MIGDRNAPGAPGLAPTWTSSAKDAVGTALGSSRVWFTIGHGILNEVYWPRIDQPRIRDLGFIVADDAGFWSEVKRDAEGSLSQPDGGAPALTVIHHHAAYELRLRYCVDDRRDAVVVEATLEDRRPPLAQSDPLRLYVLLAPHLDRRPFRDTAWIDSYKGRSMLFAEGGGAALALATSPPSVRHSVGFVGTSDGWQDFASNGRMAWSYDRAGPGNVAGLIQVRDRAVLALAFGSEPAHAGLLASAVLNTPFEQIWARYVAGWRDYRLACAPAPDLQSPLEAEYWTSAAVVRIHQDKTAPGATVASLSVPWGNTRQDIGGYHLVWSRDLVEAAGALIVLGAHDAAAQALTYLAATQEPDGHWFQNQWLDGTPYWTGIQLDEAAYPILLGAALSRSGARELHGQDGGTAAEFAGLLAEGVLRRMVTAAAGFLVRNGPVTQQDRWEENEGLTPSTLAPVIAALVEAAAMLPDPAATYCLELADDWNAAVESWTFARGTRLARQAGVEGHYVRIAAPEVLFGAPIDAPIVLRNQPPDRAAVPATEVVGLDFLALVRFGLRRADDPAILDSLAVADRVLGVDTPAGRLFRRYNGDGYGEHEDGSPFDGTGIGRAWPLLAGERGHFAVAAGADGTEWLEVMRRSASRGGLIPEQTWDAGDIEDHALRRGHPSGSAMPLVWAHAEYIKLARSIDLGHPVDRPTQAWARYQGIRPTATRALWRLNAQPATIVAGLALRLELLAPGRVSYSLDDWQTSAEIDTRDTGLGVWIVDVPGTRDLSAGRSVNFTFFWPDANRWEGRNFTVRIEAPALSS